MGNSTKELVNAFNLNNYGVVNVNTNFTVEGKKIVGLFASGTNTKEYLREIGEEIIKWHYNGESEVAGEYYNLNYFPFVNSGKEKYIDENVKKVELADSTNNEVIRNLKVHFANEFKKAVRSKVAACLQKEVGISEEEAYEWVNETVGTGAIGKPYLYCIVFDGKYLEEEGYSLRTFELFKTFYIREFNSRLEACGLKSSDFYEYKDDMLYIKDVSGNVIKSVAEYVKGRVALDFRTPGTEDSEVENFKDVLGDFIFKWTGKSINAYEYDVFTDKKKIENGNDFVLIPLTKRYSGQLESLKHKDAYKINTIHKDFVSDIRGKTAKPDVTSYENPVYAISNKRIAQLLPEIMQSPIAYNQINGRFEFAVDLENFKRRGSSRSSSTVTSPTHAGPSGLKIPSNSRKRNRDSGYDSNSPSKPKDSVAHSPSGGPSSYLTESLSPTQESPTGSHGEVGGSPRRGSEKKQVLHNPVNLAGTSKGFSPSPQLNSIAVSYGVSGPSSSVQSVGAVQDVQAGTSACSQPINPWSLQAPSAEPSLWQPSRPLSWQGANPVGANPWSQPYWSSPAPSAGLWSLPQSGPSSWKGASASDKPLTEEEKELFKELLYTLNLTNYTFDGVYTNFFTKDGKIVSLLHDNVNREKYFQAVRNYIIKECCEDEEEVRELYDLNEFPFKLNCEEKQGKTVVANISRGALSNLKILFSQKFGKNVYAIDISVVEEVEKHEKEKWVGYQLEGCTFTTEEDIKKDVKLAYTSCFPDEGPMKIIPIGFDEEESEYVLDRSRDCSEVRLLRKALPPLTTKEEVQRFLDRVLETDKTQQELSQEEKNLFKELLYAFNLNNYTFEYTYTNFIVENGKIASFIDNGVNVKEYLQELRGSTIQDYCVTKKEAYDLNEFPFKFLPDPDYKKNKNDCEKNQKITVVANISPGALSNLKKLFIHEYEKEVKIGDIDIDIVKKGVKSKKDLWVNSQVKSGKLLKVVIPTCYPKESKLKDIPIVKGGSGYSLLHDYPTKEEKPRNATTTFKAIKESKKDDSSSGYSSGFVTDAENVSSKADAITSSGYESMDCENTREGSPKRTLELSMGMEELAISTELDATKTEQLCSPIKKPRSN